MNILEYITGNKSQNKYRTNNTKNWNPPPSNWLKWKTNAFKNFVHSTTISPVCGDNIGPIQHINA